MVVGMNFLKILMMLGMTSGAGWLHADSVATQYLRHIYGAEDVDIAKVCWSHDDLWMIQGQKNAGGLEQLARKKIEHGANEVLWEKIQNALCIVEIRGGKADPRFLIDQIYQLHRQLILQFIYASLTQDLATLKGLTTQPSNVKFGRTKPPAMGDLDVYQELIGGLPIARISTSVNDKDSRSITSGCRLGKTVLRCGW